MERRVRAVGHACDSSRVIRVYADFNSRGEKDRSDKVALHGPGALSDVAQEASRIASGQVSGNRGRLRISNARR